MKFFYTIGFFVLFSLSSSAQEYDLTSPINDTLTLVVKNEKYGIEKSGSIIIPLEYDYLAYIPECDPLLFSVKVGKDEEVKFGFINIKRLKDIVPPTYDKFEPVSSPFDYFYYNVQIGEKWGLADSEGVEVVSVESDAISYESATNLGTIKYTNNVKYFKFLSTGKIEIMDQAPPMIIILEEGSSTKIFEQLDEEATFTGIGGINSFIAANLRYPDAAVDEEIEGTIVATFIVEKDGSVTNVETVRPKLGSGLEEEVIRVITKTSGLWKPAQLKDKPVRSYYRVPVTFRLSTE